MQKLVNISVNNELSFFQAVSTGVNGSVAETSKGKVLKFLVTNIDSIQNKIHELEALTADLSPDIIAVTEVNHKSSPPDSDWQPVISGYSLCYIIHLCACAQGANYCIH